MKNYFCGWYFKCQSDTQTLALIPAFHKSKDKCACSMQVITDRDVWNICLPYDEFKKDRMDFQIRVGGNYFGKKGIRLCLHTPDLSITGAVRFGKFFPIRYDIMGPFRYVPFMECRHSVVSMMHTINGNININGTDYAFNDDIGYIEGDRGYSFPKKYVWTQCCFKDGSLMLSVADIPFGVLHFTGIIGVIVWQGKEHRFATYLGAKIMKIRQEEMMIKQGDMTLEIRLIRKNHHPLFAPVKGNMSRTIHESAACFAFYRFVKGGHTLFELESDKASFEYEY